MTQKIIEAKFSSDEIHHIKILEIIHLLGNFCSGGVVSILGIVIYMAVQKDISPNVRRVAYNIINFNLSFLIYFTISVILVIVLIGILGLIVFGICWLIFMILGAIKHFAGEDYEYPMTIKFL